VLAWNFDEMPDELEPSANSSDDEEFHPRVHSDSDDDNTRIEECNTESDDLIIPDDRFTKAPDLFVFLFLFSDRSMFKNWKNVFPANISYIGSHLKENAEFRQMIVDLETYFSSKSHSIQILLDRVMRKPISD
jgi:hypothetical protein